MNVRQWERRQRLDRNRQVGVYMARKREGKPVSAGLRELGAFAARLGASTLGFTRAINRAILALTRLSSTLREKRNESGPEHPKASSPLLGSGGVGAAPGGFRRGWSSSQGFQCAGRDREPG
jgi:hypothetical protein